MATAEKPLDKAFCFLHLPEEVPPEIQKLLSRKLPEIKKYEHPLLLESLQRIRDTEKLYFEVDTVFACVLAFLLLNQLSSKYAKNLQKELQETLDSILKEEPENVVALCVRLQVIKITTKNSQEKTALQEKIKILVTRPDNLSHAFAVIAFYLCKLDQIQASIALFKQAINAWEQAGKGDDVKVIVWKYLLVETYIQLLYKETYTKVKDFNPDETMIQIKDLLQSGIDLGKKQEKPLCILAARCYVDLAISFSKYKLIGKVNERCVKLDVAPGVKQCYERAWELCGGQDPHVLEKYGIFLKKTAPNRQTLEQAAEVLQLALGMCPHRHVAAHQLALIYKALWVIEENLPQRCLYLNHVKTGKGAKKAPGKPKDAGSHKNPESDEIDACKNHEAIDNDSQEGAVGGEEYIQQADEDGLIHPKKPTDHNKVPHHTKKKPNHFHQLQADNPVLAKPPSRYLRLAKTYFEMASESAKSRRVLYIVDLARIHISYDDDAAALGYFENARRALSFDAGHSSHGEAAYLYEQWALLLLQHLQEDGLDDVTASEASDSESDNQDKRLKRTEQYFLKSIRSAVRIKSKSRIAYYKLAEMLEKVLQCNRSSPKWMVLCEIYQLVGQDEKSKKLLEEHDKTTAQARRLFKQQCIHDKEFGTYLNLMYTAYNNKPDNALRHDIVEMTLQKMKPTSDTPHDEAEPMKAYGDAMKVFLRKAMSQHPYDSQSNSEDEVLLLMARSDDPETGPFDYIVENLQHCGIMIKRYFKNNVDDFDLGCKPRAELWKGECQLFLVSDSTDCSPQKCPDLSLHLIVEDARLNKIKIPVLMLQETDNPPLEEWKEFPHLDIREVKNEASFHDFMTRLFQSICDVSCTYCTKTIRKV